MKRLIHDFRAMRRTIQISRHPVFIFVEGKIADPYFYGNIAKIVCEEHNITYSLRLASEIAGHGGKQGLLSFFQYLKKKSSLLDNFKDKKTISLFYMDKDIDDILPKKKKSVHINYTKYYDVYNHIFICGKLDNSLAAAASINPEHLQREITDCQTLRCMLAAYWKDWVKLCVFIEKRKISHQSNYSRVSQINTTNYTSVDQTKYHNLLSELHTKLNLTDTQFNRAFSRISKFVDDLYNRNEHDIVFKGRWYCYLFSSYIRQLDNSADCNGLENRLPSTIAATLDFTEPWADYFKQPLRQLINQL